MKPKLAEDLIPVTDFRSKASELLQKIKKTGRPLILTQRGRSAAVVEDVKEYENRIERLELLEAIVRGIHAAEKGDLIPHEKAMKLLDKALNA
jgi:prevent-host-death family protein